MLRRSFVAGVLATPSGALAADRPAARFSAGRSAVFGERGVAATSQPLATQAAIDLLAEGGGAVDAAIAAAAVLAVCEPMMSGPGGDLAAMVWRPQDGRLAFLRSTGAAPAAASLERVRALAGEAMPRFGALSISAPGAVAGWAALHRAYGRKPFARLLEPAIAYAEAGVRVGPQTAEDWTSLDWLKPGPGVLGDFAAARALYAPGGRVPRVGERFRNPDLAATLRRIAASGGRDVYQGRTARSLVEAVRSAGGLLTLDDLAAVKPIWAEPLTGRFRDVTVAQAPAPSQGVSVLQILALYERLAPGGGSLDDPERLHLMVESVRSAFADRAALIGDPAMGAVDVAALLSPQRLDRQAAAVSRARAGPSSPTPLEAGDTSYLAVADGEGCMVSLITSVSGAFGSGVVAPGTGFVLQNRAAGFSLQAGHPNAVAPRKQPFHTIIPGFAFREGRPWLVFGVMGGAMQPQGHAQVLARLVDDGMDLQSAGEAPRFRLAGGPQPEGGASARHVLHLETGLAHAAPSLRAKGHEVEIGLTRPDLRFGGYQAVARAADGGLSGGSEPRQDGQAAAI